MEVENISEAKIIWKSLDEKGATWFETVFFINDIGKRLTPSHEVSDRLIQILNAAKQLNPDFLKTQTGFKVTTKLDFPKNWGLGTSSTLINNIAQWAKIDPYKLLENTFGGSGYDIACAQHNNAITYQLKSVHNESLNQVPDDKRGIKAIHFNPSFKEQLYFVHLNKKQNSREGITYYNENKGVFLDHAISEINDITLKMIDCKNLSDFENLLIKHESIIAKLTKQKTVKDLLFSDFKGSIKSLGAWGGDFVLATSTENPELYFKAKGFNTIVPYNQMVL